MIEKQESSDGVREYSTRTRVQLFWVLVLETCNLEKYSYSNLKVFGLGLKFSQVHEYFDIFSPRCHDRGFI